MFSDAVSQVEKFYGTYGCDVNRSFLQQIQRALENKQEYFKPIFGEELTKVIEISKEATLEYFWDTCIGRDAKHTLTSDGAMEIIGHDYKSLEDTKILDNKIRVGKQYMKLTKVLQKLKPYFWTDVKCGDLFKKVKLSHYEVSISPYEFQTASENCGWSSCFRVHGEYHCSVWAYYLYTPSFIIKAKNKEGKSTGRVFITLSPHGAVIGRVYGQLILDDIRKIVKDYCKILDIPVDNRVCCRFYYDGSNTYIDIPTEAWGSDEDFPINLPSGINSEGDESGSGEFYGYYCECCDEHRVEGAETHDGWRCQWCIDNYYRWVDSRNEYYHEDDVVYLEDADEYAVLNLDEYYEIDGCYYSEIPDDYVLCERCGEITHIDNAIYLEDEGEYVQDYYADEYYKIEGYYYASLPDGVELCRDTEEYFDVDKLHYIVDLDEWTSCPENYTKDQEGNLYEDEDNIPNQEAS